MARARKSDKSGSGKSKAFSIFDGDENHAEDGQEDLPKDEAGRRKIKRQYEELLGIRIEKLRGRILNRERINKTIEGIYFICASCKKVCHNVDDGLVEDPNNLNNLCSACSNAKEPRGSVTRDGVRGGGGAVSASIRRRRAGCLDRPPPAAPHRRCDGAPASPLRHLARTRTARRSQACGDQAGDGLSSLHLPRRDEGARRVGPPCAALNLRRLRRSASPRPSTAAAPGKPAVRNGAARERGRRRSAYEAPNGSVAPGPVSSGAESKRRRWPRSRARQSRVTLLAGC